MNPHLNIAIFHVDLPSPDKKPGGVAITVHRLGNALAEIYGESNVTVFSLSEKPRNANYRHINLFPDVSWLRSRVASHLVLPLLLNLVNFEQFDVLHLHGDDWFFFRRSVPTIRTFHGSALREALSASTVKRYISQYIIYFLERMSARIATTSAAVNPETASLYKTPEVINNGVELDRFQPGPKTDHPSVLFVGTWEGRKRGEFIFNIFIEYVVPRLAKARLFMVSDKCKPHECVAHFSSPSDDELATLYRKSWVLAHPSVYEGFGIPYIESMASGTSIISSANPGSKYVLSDGKYGVIADDDTFAKELIDLLTSENRRRHYERKGLGRAQSFSWYNVAEQHCDLYQKAISSYSDARPKN